MSYGEIHGCLCSLTQAVYSLLGLLLGTDMGAEVIVYVAASLDGFIARSDGSIDWLDVAVRGSSAEHV